MDTYILSQEELRTIQLIQLEMLEEVDRICRKYDIRYNIIAGTLLGAVRHKGYIPWDDDADVALLRAEYDKFRRVCEKELDKDRFYFQDHRNTPGYRWGYGKLRRKNTLFIRENQEHMTYEQGIFIDIFPLDKVPNSKSLRRINNFHCFCIRKCMWAPIGVKAANRFLSKVTYKLLLKIPEKLLYNHYEKYILKQQKIDSDWVRILTFPTPNNEYGYKRQWYEESTEIEFEKKLFYGIKEWDEYLSFKFGEYQKLPEEKDRKIHPITALKLLSNNDVTQKDMVK